MRTNIVVSFIKDLIYKGLEGFGRYYSSYRAIVASNEDPDNLNRLQLIIPEIGGSEIFEQWAFPKHCFGGKDYGIQVLPKRGDIVWVEFERGNPSVPIWMHGYFADGEKPEGEDYRDPNSYWFKSPGGITLMVNDTKKYVLIGFPEDGENKIKYLLNLEGLSLVHPKKISLGSEGSSKEKAVLGDTHNSQEQKLLKAIAALTVNTAMGPSSVPINAATFNQLAQELPNILSKKVELD